MTDSQPRQHLAAILAADAVGFSRLMQDDERATVTALDQCRAVFRASIEAEAGRVVDMAGDSVLAVFDAAGGAVRAAITIQDALDAQNRPASDEPWMQFRIGVTLGDIIEKPDGTVYGDGVNIAARLQAEAEPGAVVISGTAFDSVRGKIEAGFEDLGARRIKNIDAPIRMYRVRVGSTRIRARHRARIGLITAITIVVILVAGVGGTRFGWYDRDWLPVGGGMETDPGSLSGPSIAVLPLQNRSDEGGQDYFADGLTQDIVSALGRFSTLTVLGHGATDRFKDGAATPTAIGRELGVAYLLAGGVQRAGDRVRVTAELIDVDSGNHIWSERYDGTLENVFAVQDDITRQVAGALAAKVIQAEQRRLVEAPPRNLAAYEHVLRASALLRSRTRDGADEARQLLHAALAIDPDYAAALARLAALHVVEIEYGWVPAAAAMLDEIDRLANRALAIDANQVTARVALGRAYMHRGQFAAAESEIRRALGVNPSDWEAYVALGVIQTWGSNAAPAVESFETALRLHPGALVGYQGSAAWAYFHTDRYEDCLSVMRGDRHPVALAAGVAALVRLNRLDDATAAAAELLAASPRFKVDAFARQWHLPAYRRNAAEPLKLAGLR